MKTIACDPPVNALASGSPVFKEPSVLLQSNMQVLSACISAQCHLFISIIVTVQFYTLLLMCSALERDQCLIKLALSLVRICLNRHNSVVNVR